MIPINFFCCVFHLLSIFSILLMIRLNGKWLKAAQEQLDIYLFSDSTYQQNQEHFIMYRCDAVLDTHNCGGHADRLKGIMSLYLWSLLSNRTLLVRITRPCNFAQLLEPNEVDWNRQVEFRPHEVAQIYRHGDSDFKNRLSWLNFTLLKQKKRLLVVTTNRNFLEAIARNPNYQSKLRTLGFDPTRLDMPYTFGTLYRRLFKLTPHLHRKYNEFIRRAKPTPTSKLICAQVRIGGGLYERHNEKDVKFQSVDNVNIYLKIIKEKLIPEFKSYRIFLSTDNQQVHDRFIKEFGKEKIVYNEGPFSHIDLISYSKNTDFNNCESSEKTILDFNSLQLCDSAVITNTQYGRFGMWLRPDPSKDVYIYDTYDKDLYKIESMEDYSSAI